MSGAYTAKPADVTPVDYPTGWNPVWPYPGITPPGFEWDWTDFPEVSPEPPNTDINGDEIPRIWVRPITSLHTNEHDNGAWSEEAGTFFWVQLTAKPKLGSVTIPFISSDDEKGQCFPTTTTFTSGDWNIPVQIQLLGLNDGHIEGDVDYGVVVGPSISSSSVYAGLYGNGGVALPVTSRESITKLRIVYTITNFGLIGGIGLAGVSLWRAAVHDTTNVASIIASASTFTWDDGLYEDPLSGQSGHASADSGMLSIDSESLYAVTFYATGGMSIQCTVYMYGQGGLLLGESSVSRDVPASGDPLNQGWLFLDQSKTEALEKLVIV